MFPSKPVPDSALMRRHLAAMRIIAEVDPEERVTLLAYVVAPTEAVLRAETEAREAEEVVASSF